MSTGTPQHTDPQTEQAPGVSRRLVTRTAAWATPVVLSAATAPAYAAASDATCTDRGSQVLTNKIGTQVLQFGMGDATTGPHAVVTTSARNSGGRAITAGKDNGTLQRTSYFLPYIKISIPDVHSAHDTVTLTLTLDRPVSNLRFTITTVDNDTVDGWEDQVVIAPETFIIASSGLNVYGRGTAKEPFTGVTNRAVTDAKGDVTVRFPGAVQVVTISCIAGITQTMPTPQYVGVGAFSYDNCA